MRLELNIELNRKIFVVHLIKSHLYFIFIKLLRAQPEFFRLINMRKTFTNDETIPHA